MPDAKAFLISVTEWPLMTILTVIVYVCPPYPHAWNKLDPGESLWGAFLMRDTELP